MKVKSIEEGLQVAEEMMRARYGDKIFDLKTCHCTCEDCKQFKGYELKVIYVGAEEYTLVAYKEGVTVLGPRVYLPFAENE